MDALTPPPSGPSRGHEDLECFAGDGEMAALMRTYDWSSTPLRPGLSGPKALKPLSVLFWAPAIRCLSGGGAG